MINVATRQSVLERAGYPVISVTHLDGGKVVCEVEPEKWDDDIDELMEVVEFWCKEGWQRKLPHEIFEA
jgi:hypothetical protein